MATLAVGSDPGDRKEEENVIAGAKTEEPTCQSKMYNYIEGLGKSKNKIRIWNEIVDLILKFINVDNLIAMKSQIQQKMMGNMEEYFDEFVNINNELNLINCLKTDIKDVLEQVVNKKATYVLTKKPPHLSLMEEDGCYTKYPIIAWYLYKTHYGDKEIFWDGREPLLPEPKENSINTIHELISYIRSEKWLKESASSIESIGEPMDNHPREQPRSSSVARMEDVEFIDDEDFKESNMPPTPVFAGKSSANLFRKSDFEGLPKLEIPQARGWVKNVIKKSETSTPERYAGSHLFTCDICRQEGVKKLKPMTRQALADHIKNKHAYHSPAKKSSDLTSSKPTDELEKMNTGDTNISFPSSSSLGVRDRSPSFSPSITPSMSREPSSDILTLKKMNSKDSLDSITPERGPKGRKVKKRKKMKRQKLRSHSSGDLDEPPITSALPGMSVKRSTSFESTFGNDNRKVSPKSNNDTGNVFNPLYDTMDLRTNERLRPPTPMVVEDVDPTEYTDLFLKRKKKGGKSKSRRRRKKRTKKKSRRKKRN